jgi:hypothetical protein
MIGVVSCGNQSDRENRETTQERKRPESGFTLHFDEDTLDFGTIDTTREENEFLTKEFIFVNHNDAPIIILRASVSCVCLSVEIPNEPILSGEKGVVKVTLDTKRVNGRFSRSVFVSSNADNDVELLRVTGIVNR